MEQRDSFFPQIITNDFHYTNNICISIFKVFFWINRNKFVTTDPKRNPCNNNLPLTGGTESAKHEIWFELEVNEIPK